MKLPKWLITACVVVNGILNLLGGAGLIPPVVRLNTNATQPIIGASPAPAPVTGSAGAATK